MNEQTLPDVPVTVISLPRLFSAVVQHIRTVALVAVFCSVVAFLGTYLFITPIYEASTKLYVNNSNDSSSGSISSGDLSASRNLVDSYIVILNTPETFREVIAYTGIHRTTDELSEMVAATAVNDTEIFEIIVTSSDPNEAVLIADAIAHVLPERIAATIEGTSTRIVEAAALPTVPSSPCYPQNITLGFLIGLALVVVYIVLREIVDTSIRKEEDIRQICHYPILTAVPHMVAASKCSGFYAHRHHCKTTKSPGNVPELIGNNISSAASEAYKLLRTKLLFSFTENGSHIIGISSALSEEGKSLTAINLAYALSELGKKVILIDCNMRRPTLAENLKIREFPGFSSYLTGQSDLPDLIGQIKSGETGFHVISAGQTPPDPNALFRSANMRAAMDTLRQTYDYVLLDLPSVSGVNDALTVSDFTDGILLVVRENHCNRRALANAIRRFEHVNTNLLGIVVNYTAEGSAQSAHK